MRRRADPERVFQRFALASPNPESDLRWTSPFELLVAVVLSAQTTDQRVNSVTLPLFAEQNTPEAMLALGEEALSEAIKSIGLYRNKARHLIALCQALIARHGSQVPGDRAALEALPGVGRKTANVVLNVVFGQATIAVDTHVFRVAHRLGLSTGKTPLAVEQDLERLVPEPFRLNAHHWLILHGRYTCTARAPHCTRCVLGDLCPKIGLEVRKKVRKKVRAT